VYITLFLSLFAGRTDVYAVRWESTRTGKSGYSPACRHEWIRDVCRKPQIKCGECPARELLPLQSEVIERHIFGSLDSSDAHPKLDKDAVHGAGLSSNPGRDFVVGIYPLHKDETCRFLAADFDKKDWAADIHAFRATCHRLGIPVAVERSRSGNGAHTWIFFSESVPALLARRLGSSLLTETHESRPEIGFDSYDRLFPNQDNLPSGGFGNLIALPLQCRAVQQANTLFLGENMVPVPNQWDYLREMRRLSLAEVEELVEKAARRGKIMGVRLPVTDEDGDEPWKRPPSRRWPQEQRVDWGPVPAEIKVILKDQLYIPKQELPPLLRSRLVRLAAFQNPEFYKAQALRLSTFGKPRIVSCAEDHPRHIALPRGVLDEAMALLSEAGIRICLDDQRFSGSPLDVKFSGTLRPEQQRAAEALLSHETGVLAAATAFGKTVVAAMVIAEREVNTLVLVHRKQLLDQWRTRLAEFLDLPEAAVGALGGGKRKLTGALDIALIQSLNRGGEANDLISGYGQLIVDECHHLPAESFERVAKRCPAKYVLGLSATTARRDGHQVIIFMQCGSIRFRWTAKQGVQDHPFRHRVVIRMTKFTPLLMQPDKNTAIHSLYDGIISDAARNDQIIQDIMDSVAKDKRSPLVLTERREHLELLAARFRGFIKNVIVLHGGMGIRERRESIRSLLHIPDTEERLILATGRYLGEGFDDARLDTLFLTMPISWRGTLAQYAGRLHRLHADKREVRIYDYADISCPVLTRMFRRRLAGYKAIGYETKGSGLNI
jgi:superfamily II DNA or RNA helicase